MARAGVAALLVSVAAAAHAHRRHAVVVVSEVSQRLMRYLRRHLAEMSEVKVELR